MPCLHVRCCGVAPVIAPAPLNGRAALSFRCPRLRSGETESHTQQPASRTGTLLHHVEKSELPNIASACYLKNLRNLTRTSDK